MNLKITLHSAAAEEIIKNYITFLDPGGINHVIIVGPTVNIKTGWPQNWTLDPTPKTPLDPPPQNSLCTVFCWENQHLHKEFGCLSPLLDPPARVPPKFFMQIFVGYFFRS